MKMKKKILALLMVFCLTGVLPTASVRAASPDDYTYTVRIYAGNQGTFTDSVNLFVDHTKSKSTRKSEVKMSGGMVTVTGLVRNDFVAMQLQTDSIQMTEGAKYYVKGIRQSGRDNSTVATSVLEVDRDADYVVAYGVKGKMVKYTVNYQDAAGGELLPSDEFYGNIGDKPVVAYKYVEGYEPEVRALTKTLDANEAENVFTFVYTPTDQAVVTRQVGTPGTTTTTVTEVIPGAVTTTTTETVPEAGVPAAAAGEEEAAAPEEETTGEEETADEGEIQPPVQEIGDEEVPLANTDLKDLDEEEVPASNIQLDKVVKKGLPLAACVGIALAASVGLGVLGVVVKRRKSKAVPIEKK